MSTYDLGTEWQDAASRFTEAAGVIARYAPSLTPLDAAEGHRLFLRYLGIGIDSFIEHADPRFPVFYAKSRDGVRKFAGDSPSQLYDTAPISAEFEYLVSGSMHDVALIELGVYSGDLSGLNPAPRRLIDYLTEADLAPDADGRFTVLLSREPGEGRLLLEDDASVLSVRRYLRDPLRDRPGPLRIERLGEPVAHEPLSAEALAAGVRAASSFALANVSMWAQWVERLRTEPVNEIRPMPDSGDIYTPGGHSYLHGHWRLPSPGSALVLEFAAPPAPAYWSVVPMNYWLESFEWRFGDRVHATSHDTDPGPDGIVRLVLAQSDPGLADHTWIRTLGHDAGPIAFRFARLAGEAPNVSCRLIDSAGS